MVEAGPSLGAAHGDRFEVKKLLGWGSMGVVYRAHDRVRRMDVALKTLRRVEGSMLYRFKQEFRSLADLVHPHLVTLYELRSAGDQWFFTMELIDGVSFLEHVRPHKHLITRPEPIPTQDLPAAPLRTVLTTSEPGPQAAPPTHGTMPSQAVFGRASPVTGALRRALEAATLDADRLRAALGALVDGVHALHQAGKLHRDLKPSNVLVDAAGRVVVCDFGLVAAAGGGEVASEDTRGGTPGYMSPEQCQGATLGPASDWYSVGVMIYEALTGRLPFEGSAPEILHLKQTRQPAPPREVAPGVPADLDRLCMALLASDPAARPDGAALLATLGRAPGPRPALVGPFVGREAHLDALHDALAATHRGGVAVLVHGRSGMGKSALVRHFLDQVRHNGAVTLEGRCYERESVPFKALDALVDALTSWLLRIPPEQVAGLMPRELAALTRLFPVLSRVPVADAAERPRAPRDPHELRQRAFGALRHLLTCLCALRPTVVHIDDLQWGDSDSAPFLIDLVHHPKAPPLLFIGSYRSEDAGSSPLLGALLGAAASGRQLRRLAVDVLSDDDARQLALGVLGEGGGARADEILREAGGSPLFIAELARQPDTPGQGGLDELLWQRIARLPEPARALLCTAAVAGRPLPVALVSQAAALEDEASALAALQAERLVRTRYGAGGWEVEPYHDRVRETAMLHLEEAESQRIHRRLAEVLTADLGASANGPDALALVQLWQGAREPAQAGAWAVRAAALAEEKMAFDRAAYHYRLALELAPLAGAERRTMQIKLADALANAGDLDGAAQAYLQAAEGAERHQAIELRRLALEQLLRRGRFDDGVAMADSILAEVGLSMPRTRAGVLGSIVLRRAWLKLRGLRFRAREGPLPAAEALRIDVCWSVTSGMTLIDPVMATAFQMRHLTAALRAGDPLRAALALGLEIGFRSLGGIPTRAAVEQASTLAHEVARQSGNQAASGLATATSGLAAFLRGDFKGALERLLTGERQMLDNASGFRWQIDVCQIFRVSALLYLGRLRELGQHVRMLLREARGRGDAYLAGAMRSWRGNHAWLLADEPEEARRVALQAGPAPDGAGAFHLQHYYRLVTHANIDLYAGDPAAAWRRVTACWPGLVRSMVLRTQSVRIEGWFLRARCALALAAHAPEQSGALLAEVEAAARRIERERAPWGAPLAELARAAAAALRGQRAPATALLERAARGFAAVHMDAFAAVARRRHAELAGDDAAAGEAHAWLQREAVARPERLVALFAPGFTAG